MKLVRKYFPHLNKTQLQQFEQLGELYAFWNMHINVISRKDIDNLYLHHVLHSLSIAKVVELKRGAEILDIGTGGGFPGIPLAILFPDAKFHLVDSIGKKIKIVNEVVIALGLKNVVAEHVRAESIAHQYDFIVSRAVTRINRLFDWSRDKIKTNSIHDLKNGMLALKGGDINEELSLLNQPYHINSISDWFKEDFFTTKTLIHIGMRS